MQRDTLDKSTVDRYNGAGAAAILAASIGAATLGLLTCATDKLANLKRSMNFYAPSGPLSGVTSCSIAVWLLIWLALHLSWSKRELKLQKVAIATFILVAIALVFTYPPFVDHL